MTGNSSNEPVDPLPSGHWWAEQTPAPLPAPPIVPPEPEVTLGDLWRAHQQRRALFSPFPRVESDPYAARLSFAVAVLVAGVFAWFVGMKAGADQQPAWLALLAAPAVVGIVLLLIWRRVPDRATRRVLMFTGRGLLWPTLLVGLLSFGCWSFLAAL